MTQQQQLILSQRYQLALLDLDGVVYRGANAVEHAVSAIRSAEQQGMTIMYTTNNSSRFAQTVAKQLEGFGLRVTPWQVITSSIVAARMVAHHIPGGSPVVVCGAEHLRQSLTEQGLQVVENLDDHPVAAVQGWYPDMTWKDMARISYAVEAGAKYFVTNHDLTIPREDGIAPGCGSMIQAVINATGVEPIASAGKPESAMYDEARAIVASEQSTSSELSVPVESCLAIGDRLDTDIEAGNRGGYDSFAVLTGVTNPRELMLAKPILRPTYIAADLRGLNEIYDEPQQINETSVVCAEASATFDGAGISVNEHSIHALRASVKLAWKLADEGENVESIELPNFDVEALLKG